MKKYLLGWLSPTGDFIKSDEGEHGNTASEILIKLGHNEEEVYDIYFYPAEYLIYYYNYALIHMPEYGFKVVHFNYHMLTNEQKLFIERYEQDNDVDFIEQKITKRDVHIRKE